MSLQAVLQNPQKLDILARGLAKRGIAPPRDLVTAGVQAAAQRIKQQQAPANVGGQVPNVGQLMSPRQSTLIPQGMPQIPFAPSTPSPVTGIGELMTPRR